MDDVVPYAYPSVGDNDLAEVLNVLNSHWWSSGPRLEMFETRLRESLQCDFAFACSSGTAALHLAMLALGIGRGDYVLVPAISFLASANAVRYVGAEVIFVDVDPLTGLMSPQTLANALEIHKSKSLKAVVNVHLAGQCENLEAVSQLAKSYGLYVIEDAAHAMGSVYLDSQGQAFPIGKNAFSNVTCFSFHAVKTVACGEGGAITCSDPAIARQIGLFRSHGVTRCEDKFVQQCEAKDGQGNSNLWYYEMAVLGYNYRLSDIQCALAHSQLQRLAELKSKRQQIVAMYKKSFAKENNICLIRQTPHGSPCWHLAMVLIDFGTVGVSRAVLMAKLREQGIGTQVHYIPIYRQPYYRKRYGEQVLEGCEQYYERALSLPLIPTLTLNEHQTFADKIKKVISGVTA